MGPFYLIVNYVDDGIRRCVTSKEIQNFKPRHSEDYDPAKTDYRAKWQKSDLHSDGYYDAQILCMAASMVQLKHLATASNIKLPANFDQMFSLFSKKAPKPKPVRAAPKGKKDRGDQKREAVQRFSRMAKTVKEIESGKKQPSSKPLSEQSVVSAHCSNLDLDEGAKSSTIKISMNEEAGSSDEDLNTTLQLESGDGDDTSSEKEEDSEDDDLSSTSGCEDNVAKLEKQLKEMKEKSKKQEAKLRELKRKAETKAGGKGKEKAMKYDPSVVNKTPATQTASLKKSSSGKMKGDGNELSQASMPPAKYNETVKPAAAVKKSSTDKVNDTLFDNDESSKSPVSSNQDDNSEEEDEQILTLDEVCDRVKKDLLAQEPFQADSKGKIHLGNGFSVNEKAWKKKIKVSDKDTLFVKKLSHAGWGHDGCKARYIPGLSSRKTKRGEGKQEATPRKVDVVLGAYKARMMVKNADAAQIAINLNNARKWIDDKMYDEGRARKQDQDDEAS